MSIATAGLDGRAIVSKSLLSFGSGLTLIIKRQTLSSTICDHLDCLLPYFFFLIFKTQAIIRILKLDKGFDQENFQLKVHRSTILSIATVVIGGVLLAEEIPNFCHQLYAYFVEKKVPISYTVLSASKIIIGLLLIWNRREIVNFVELRRKK